MQLVSMWNCVWDRSSAALCVPDSNAFKQGVHADVLGRILRSCSGISQLELQVFCKEIIELDRNILLAWLEEKAGSRLTALTLVYSGKGVYSEHVMDVLACTPALLSLSIKTSFTVDDYWLEVMVPSACNYNTWHSSKEVHLLLCSLPIEE